MIRKNYLPALRACNSLKEARQVHDRIVQDGSLDSFLENHLVQTYGHCGCLDEAKRLFDGMRCRNSYSWNILMDAYAQNGHLYEVDNTFERMAQWDFISWTTTLVAHTRSGLIHRGKWLFDCMPQKDIVAWNAVITGYAVSGRLQQAKALFDVVPRRTIVTWTPLIVAYGEFKDVQRAKELFDCIPVVDAVVWNAMVAAYGCNGYLSEALAMFETAQHRTVISWNTMVTAFSMHGHLERATDILKRMPALHVASWNAMITAYAQWGDSQAALKMFQSMPERNVVTLQSMITVHGASGRVEEAERIFHAMEHRDLLSWNAMISAYAQANHGKKAVLLFAQMDVLGVSLDKATWSNMIQVCTRFNFARLGEFLRDEILANSSTLLDDMMGGCLVIMFGKFSKLEEARHVFSQMPVTLNSMPWACMIQACAVNAEYNAGLMFYQRMPLEGVLPDGITFIHVLSNCCHGGLLDEGRKHFRSIVEDYGLRLSVDHYSIMADLLARSGQLKRAHDLIDNMPFQPNNVNWRSLLSASKTQGSLEHGHRAATHLTKLQPECSSPYVILSNSLYSI